MESTPDFSLEALERALRTAADLSLRGSAQDADALCHDILRRWPGQPDALLLLAMSDVQGGAADRAMGRLCEALPAAGDIERLGLLADILKSKNRVSEAAGLYRYGLQAFPQSAELHFKLGNALTALGNIDNAIGSYRQALRFDATSVGALINLANNLSLQGQIDESLALFARALELAPGSIAARNGWANTLKNAGRTHDAVIAFEEAVAMAPQFAGIHSNLIHTMLFDPESDRDAIREQLRQWDQRHGAPWRATIRPHLNDSRPDRRLRVGYISPDFRKHCQSYFTLPLLSHHDHGQFEIFCYADIANPDAVTQQVRLHADQWRDVTGQSDERVAEIIRADQIDILVDLTMHMVGNRLAALARKPAPVQVCWLAYPGSTGLAAMDYRLTDPHLDPPGAAQESYSEKSLYLPTSFWCYSAPAEAMEVGSLSALSRGFITFGCLNNFCKVNDRVLRVWSHVLGQVKDSRLIMLAPAGSCRQRTLDVFESEGISAARVEFTSHMAVSDYFRQYQGIDIVLDTLPYNGHTTSMDALWMGVPVVTQAGDRVVGRGGVSLLKNLGMPELIAHQPAEFVRIASNLAGDLPRLGSLRDKLRECMTRSRLMDGGAFARNVEALYREGWRRWCARR